MHMLIANHLAALVTLLGDRIEHGFGDLSPRSASVLLTLQCRGPLGVSAVARIVGTSQPTATRLIDGLVARGLVMRGDRTGKFVSAALTELGKARAGKLQADRLAVTEDLLSTLRDEERRAFGLLIEKLMAAGTEGRDHARTTCRYCDHDACFGDACPIDRRATEIEADGPSAAPP